MGNPSNPTLDAKSVNKIIKNYENHPSIFKIKENITVVTHFTYLLLLTFTR